MPEEQDIMTVNQSPYLPPGLTVSRNYVVYGVDFESGDRSSVQVLNDDKVLTWYDSYFFSRFSSVPQPQPSIPGLSHKEQVFQRWIEPLICTVRSLCDINRIAVLMHFDLGRPDGDPEIEQRCSTTAIITPDRNPTPQLLAAAKSLDCGAEVFSVCDYWLRLKETTDGE